MAKCFVINACGTIDAEMRRVLPLTDQDRAYLEDPANLGGSSIISPSSRVIAGPLGAEEAILYADADLEEAVRAKLTHDFAGHYNRPDVFQLRLNTDAPQILQRSRWTGSASQPDPDREEISVKLETQYPTELKPDRPSSTAATRTI
jgi:nitrilase